MKNFLPALAVAGTVALSQITMSGTIITLEPTDIASFGGGISGVAQTLFNVFTPMFPYVLMIIGAGVAIALIRSTVTRAIKKRK